MFAEGFALLAFLVLGVGGPFLLYLLVRAEREDRTTATREDAERLARRDRDDRR
ncbi:MAG: hypothetical protein ABEJ28_06170 [Salinigranum sp.]